MTLLIPYALGAIVLAYRWVQQELAEEAPFRARRAAMVGAMALLWPLTFAAAFVFGAVVVWKGRER